MDKYLDDIAKLYDDCYAEHGDTAKSVGWGNAKKHSLRFEKLISCIDARPGEDYSLNDLGCGYGALYHYLNETGNPPTVFYGYDISERMIAAAHKGLPETVHLFQSCKLKTVADYSIASGVFNVRGEVLEVDWLSYIQSTLDNMNECSTKGFAFNLLTTYVEWKDPKLFYGDPLHFFDFCKTNFSKKVSLLHDYELWEWTMVVRKESAE